MEGIFRKYRLLLVESLKEGRIRSEMILKSRSLIGTNLNALSTVKGSMEMRAECPWRWELVPVGIDDALYSSNESSVHGDGS